MALRIEHHSTSEWPAVRVYEALADIDYLRGRLQELGGSNTELVEHESTESGLRFEVRQGVSVGALPTVARTLIGGDLIIDRSESWRRAEENHYTGEIAAEMAGVPCTITGSMWLRDVLVPAERTAASPGGASEFLVDGLVRVNIPLFGGRLETHVVDQVRQLLSAEALFTADWLKQREA